jgi:hypothetical protein
MRSVQPVGWVAAVLLGLAVGSARGQHDDLTQQDRTRQDRWQEGLGQQEQSELEFKVGDRVEVLSQRKWYAGEVVSISRRDKYRVRFKSNDGSHTILFPPDKVRRPTEEVSGLLAEAEPLTRMRTWTDKEGRTRRASLVEADDENAVLHVENGKRYTVPLNVLSQRDRLLIRRLLRQRRERMGYEELEQTDSELAEENVAAEGDSAIVAETGAAQDVGPARTTPSSPAQVEGKSGSLFQRAAAAFGRLIGAKQGMSVTTRQDTDQSRGHAATTARGVVGHPSADAGHPATGHPVHGHPASGHTAAGHPAPGAEQPSGEEAGDEETRGDAGDRRQPEADEGDRGDRP